MLVRLLAAAGAIAALASSPAVQAQEVVAPDALVKNVTLEVADILRKDKDIQSDRKKMIALVDAKIVPHFNFTSMTASAVGTNWSKATPDQKAKLTDEFRTLMVRTYASSIASFKDQKFDFRPLRATPTDTDVTVNVRVIQPGAQPVKIDYDMEKTSRGWKVWDSKTEWYHEEIAKKGMKVLKPSPALESGFKKIGEQLTVDWLKRAGAEGQAVVDAYRKM